MDKLDPVSRIKIKRGEIRKKTRSLGSLKKIFFFFSVMAVSKVLFSPCQYR